ncbi:hypothetical protein PVAP13_2NG558703 [Panicum virgatum]|uniref:Uncharacterized protein n=1 Tax=Panicum virgatum TaxID=38727 RepID=A0A8T0VRX9_PANVG|nr:hypothetical protein PVAP13_2NG558703 [Panicum virgatum]
MDPGAVHARAKPRAGAGFFARPASSPHWPRRPRLASPRLAGRPAGRFVSRPSITHRGLIRWEERAPGDPADARASCFGASARSLAFPSQACPCPRACVSTRRSLRFARRAQQARRAAVAAGGFIVVPDELHGGIATSGRQASSISTQVSRSRPPATGGRLSPDRTCVTVRERDSLRPGTAAG